MISARFPSSLCPTDTISSLHWHPTSTSVFVCTSWDHSVRINAFRWSEDEAASASAASTSSAQCSSGAGIKYPRSTMYSHTAPVLCSDITATGKVYSGGCDCAVYEFDITKEIKQASLVGHHSQPVCSVHAIPQFGDTLLTVGWDSQCHLWDTRAPYTVNNVVDSPYYQMTKERPSLRFRLGGAASSRAAAAVGAGFAALQRLAELVQQPSWDLLVQQHDSLKQLSSSQDKKQFVTCSDLDFPQFCVGFGDRIEIFDLRKDIVPVDFIDLSSFGWNQLSCVKISARYGSVFAGSTCGRVAEFHRQNRKSEFVFKAHRLGAKLYPINCISLYPSAALPLHDCVAATGGDDGNVYFWNLRKKILTHKLPKQTQSITASGFNVDGSMFAAAASPHGLDVLNDAGGAGAGSSDTSIMLYSFEDMRQKSKVVYSIYDQQVIAEGSDDATAPFAARKLRTVYDFSRNDSSAAQVSVSDAIAAAMTAGWQEIELDNEKDLQTLSSQYSEQVVKPGARCRMYDEIVARAVPAAAQPVPSVTRFQELPADMINEILKFLSMEAAVETRAVCRSLLDGVRSLRRLNVRLLPRSLRFLDHDGMCPNVEALTFHEHTNLMHVLPELFALAQRSSLVMLRSLTLVLEPKTNSWRHAYWESIVLSLPQLTHLRIQNAKFCSRGGTLLHKKSVKTSLKSLELIRCRETRKGFPALSSDEIPIEAELRRLLRSSLTSVNFSGSRLYAEAFPLLLCGGNTASGEDTSSSELQQLRHLNLSHYIQSEPVNLTLNSGICQLRSLEIQNSKLQRFAHALIQRNSSTLESLNASFRLQDEPKASQATQAPFFDLMRPLFESSVLTNLVFQGNALDINMVQTLLRRLPALTSLDLSFCHLFAIPLPVGTVISPAVMQQQLVFPSHMAKSLKHLNLYGIEVYKGLARISFEHLLSLKTVNLGYIRFQEGQTWNLDEIVQDLCINNEQLENLIICNNSGVSMLPMTAAARPSLRELDVRMCPNLTTESFLEFLSSVRSKSLVIKIACSQGINRESVQQWLLEHAAAQKAVRIIDGHGFEHPVLPIREFSVSEELIQYKS